MLRTSMTLMGLTGAIFLACGFAPASTTGSFASSSGFLKQVTGSKGDRIANPAPAKGLTSVSIVEVVGVSHATVILRDHNGEVLYRSDPRSGTTVYSKNTDLPVITLKEEPQGSVVQHPVARQEGNQTQPGPVQKRRPPVGCMGDVSPLAKGGANRMPSLCLAGLEQSLT